MSYNNKFYVNLCAKIKMNKENILNSLKNKLL